MSRYRPSSFTRFYSTLSSPRHNHKTICIANNNWTSRRMTTRSVGTYALEKSMDSNFPSLEDKFSIHVPFATAPFSLLPQFLPVSVRYSSNNSTLNNDINEIRKKGQECYKLATEALKNASMAKEEHEERMRQEQFDAMDQQRKKTQQREQQRQNKRQQDPRLQKLNDAKDMNMNNKEVAKDRAAGVAVVRTIVKQSQSNNAVHIEKSYGNPSNKASNAKANKQIDYEEHWQQVAKKQMEEAAFRYGHCLALVRLGNEALDRAKDDSSSMSLIDRGRCEEWMNESPINLATILELSANVEGDSGKHADSDFNIEESLPPYIRLALHLYEEAGKQGSAEGWYNLGHMLWDESDTHSNSTKERAMDAFHKAMELGDADAMYFVASQYLSHEEGEEEGNALLLSNTFNQYGTAFITLLQSTTPGSPPTKEQSELSSLSNDLQQHGCNLLQHAARDHNHGPALHHLALLHIQHDNVEEFRQLLSKAAATGNPDSLFVQGHCYYSGTDGYDQNFSAALEDFLAAAENEHVDAMVSAGAMLHQGVISKDGRMVIIERDQQRAFELYQQAGELGSVEGWRNVVSCYATGQGVPKSLETAKYIANTMLKEDDN